jgi:hypothetical protein
MDTQTVQNDSVQLTELEKIQNTLKMLVEEQARLRELVTAKATDSNPGNDDMDALAEQTSDIASSLDYIEKKLTACGDLDALAEQTDDIASSLGFIEKKLTDNGDLDGLAEMTGDIASSLDFIERKITDIGDLDGLAEQAGEIAANLKFIEDNNIA